MNNQPIQRLHILGQSLWLENITRDLLNSGTLPRYIDELSVTRLTSVLEATDKIHSRVLPHSEAAPTAIV